MPATLTFALRNPKPLTYTDKRPIGWGKPRKAWDDSAFARSPTAYRKLPCNPRCQLTAPAGPAADPLSVLYAEDQDYFGKQFENPLRDTAWW